MTALTPCPRCRRPKKAMFRLCWKCKSDDDRDAAFQEGVKKGSRAGYETGFDAGYAQAVAELPGNVMLNSARVRQLLQLCHPDKHDNSTAANNVTQWLLTARQELRALGAGQ